MYVSSALMAILHLEVAASYVIKHPPARPANPQQLMSVLHVTMAIIWMVASVKHVLKATAQNVQQVHQYARNTSPIQVNSPSKHQLEKLFRQSAILSVVPAQKPTLASVSPVSQVTPFKMAIAFPVHPPVRLVKIINHPNVCLAIVTLI